MTSPTPLQRLEALTQARSLIAANHCTSANARNKDGEEVAAWDDDAVSFCAFGAAMRACGLNTDFDSPGYKLWCAVAEDLRNAVDAPGIPEYERSRLIVQINDGEGLEPTLNLYDAAIDRVKTELS